MFVTKYGYVFQSKNIIKFMYIDNYLNSESKCFKAFKYIKCDILISGTKKETFALFKRNCFRNQNEGQGYQTYVKHM